MRVLSFLSRHHVDKYESHSGKAVGYLMKKKISIKSFKPLLFLYLRLSG